MTEYNVNDPSRPGYHRSEVDVNVVPGTRWIDRVRWSAVIAGLVSALATTVLLSVLGVAIGLSVYDAGDSARGYTVGAGIWAIVTAIIAFFIGGWVAARTAATPGSNNGLINGAMVWATTIPLMLLAFSGGLSSFLGNTGNTGGERVIRAAVNMPNQDVSQGNINLQTDRGSYNVNTEEARKTASKAAWWTLGSLLLGLGAAALGGLAGARDYFERRDFDTTTTTTTPPRTV